jgi:peroxiredoxin family protein
MDERNNKATIILHSGEMDKVISALIVGNGALAMGMDVSIYFTFWGLQRLKKGGLEKGPLSKMHMGIMGVKPEDLRQNLITEYCAVGTYVQEARESKITLFI